MVFGTGAGDGIEAYLEFADTRSRLEEFSPKDDNTKDIPERSCALQCDYNREFRIVLRRSGARAAASGINVVCSLDGRHLDQYIWYPNTPELVIEMMPRTEEEGRTTYHSLRFGALDQVDDIRDADLGSDKIGVLSRIRLTLQRGTFGKAVKQKERGMEELGIIYEKHAKFGSSTTFGKKVSDPSPGYFTFIPDKRYPGPFYVFNLAYGMRPALVQLRLAPPLPEQASRGQKRKLEPKNSGITIDSTDESADWNSDSDSSVDMAMLKKVYRLHKRMKSKEKQRSKGKTGARTSEKSSSSSRQKKRSNEDDPIVVEDTSDEKD